MYICQNLERYFFHRYTTFSYILRFRIDDEAYMLFHNAVSTETYSDHDSTINRHRTIGGMRMG
jgi:hypothetical protein